MSRSRFHDLFLVTRTEMEAPQVINICSVEGWKFVHERWKAEYKSKHLPDGVLPIFDLRTTESRLPSPQLDLPRSFDSGPGFRSHVMTIGCRATVNGPWWVSESKVEPNTADRVAAVSVGWMEFSLRTSSSLVLIQGAGSSDAKTIWRAHG